MIPYSPLPPVVAPGQLTRLPRAVARRYLGDKELKFVERFLAAINMSADGDCWVWTATHSGGYGQIKHEGKYLRAHRVSYELFVGPIPEGMHVCHDCDNPSCVNPNHLWCGTDQDNSDDKLRKRRHVFGEQNNTTKLTTEDVRMIRAIGDSLPAEQLGERFGVHRRTILDIVTGKTWKHVK